MNMKTTLLHLLENPVRRALMLAALLAPLALPPIARADVVFDDFEFYAPGSNLHGQGGWAGWANDPNAGALVSTAHAHSPTRSVNITGASDLVRPFPSATNGPWVFSVQQFIPSSSTGSTYVILMNRYRPPYDAANLRWSVQVQCDLATGRITSDFGNSAWLPLVKDQWVEFRCEVNLASNTVSEFYNGALLSTHPWQDGTGDNTVAALDLYANNAGPVYYDDLRLQFKQPPVITQQPQSQTAYPGGTVTFTVEATSTTPLAQQWYFHGDPITDATQTNLTIAPVTIADAGEYTVVVSNAFGSVTSAPAVLTVSTNCINPPPGMVGWWPGDNNARDLQNGHHGVMVGGATFNPSGKVAATFSLDGIHDYVRIPSSPSLNPSASLTIDAWIYLTADGTFPIVTKWGDSGPWSEQRAYALHTTPGRGVNFAISDYANQWNTLFHTFTTPGGEIPLNTWTLVAAVYDQPTGTRRIFVDGVQVASRTDPPVTITSSIADLTIGAWLRSPTDESYFFPGMIDEVELFDRALAQQEIQAIFNAGSAGKCKPGCLTPLMLSCATNKTVQCGSAWSFDPPTATQPDCTNVIITVLSTVSNGVCPQTITRTWQATDCCSNTAACSQSVTVVDTIPPVISCPSNIVRYVCTNQVQAFYKAKATDNCAKPVPVTYSPPSGSWFAAGTTTTVTATATDACGNTSQCSFTVKVVDQTVWQTVLCGVDDCYRRRYPTWWQRYEPVCGPSACLVSAYPAATWKWFDDSTVDRFVGNSWSGLPSGILGAQLFTRMRPNCSGQSTNDTVSLGLSNCTPPNWLWSRQIGASGGVPGLLAAPWCGQTARHDVPFSFNLAALPGGGNLLPHMNAASHRLDMLVQDDTTVDYARLRICCCLPGPVVGGLTPTLSSANLVYGWNWRYCLIPFTSLPPASPFGAIFPLGGSINVSLGTTVGPLPLDGAVSFMRQLGGGGESDLGLTLKAIRENGVQVMAEIPPATEDVRLTLGLGGVVVASGVLPVSPGATNVALLELDDLVDTVDATLQFSNGAIVLRLAAPLEVQSGFGSLLVDTISCGITENWDPPWTVVSPELVLRGLGVSQIEFFDLRLEVGDAQPNFGGDVLAQVAGGQLGLSPLDANSGDPFWFNVDTAPTNELRVLLGEAIPTDGEAFSTNASLTLTTRGIAGGVERDLPGLRYTRDGAMWNLSAVRDGLPLPFSRVEIWSGGVRVAEGTDVSGLVVSSPAPVAWPTVIWFVDDDICYRNTWPNPVQVMLDGQLHQATEVRVQTDTYGAPVTALTGQHVEATALGALIFGGLETGPATYVLEVPEAGPTGVNIRWGGIGGVLEGAPTVNGPWTLVPGANPGEVTLPAEGTARFFRVRGM
jgi:hypothetical protein